VVREICGPTWLCAFCLFGGNISDKVWDKAEGRTCAGPSSILDLQSSIRRALDLPFSIRLPAPRAEQETKATEKERGYGLTPHPHPRRMKCHNSRTDPEDESPVSGQPAGEMGGLTLRASAKNLFLLIGRFKGMESFAEFPYFAVKIVLCG
jgi:hypothetical protein